MNNIFLSKLNQSKKGKLYQSLTTKREENELVEEELQGETRSSQVSTRNPFIESQYSSNPTSFCLTRELIEFVLLFVFSARGREEKSEPPETPKYRDRAKERREDQNPDYEQTELGSFHAVAPPGAVALRLR